MRLLDGVEKFGEKWSEVAAYVGQRTPKECIEVQPRLSFDLFISANVLFDSTLSVYQSRRS